MKKLTTLGTAAALMLSSAGISLAGGPTIVAAEAEPVAQEQAPKAAMGGLGIGGILLGAAAIGVVAAIVADDGSSSTTTTPQPN